MSEKVAAALNGTMGQFGLGLDNFLDTTNYRPGHAARKGSQYSIRTIKNAAEATGEINQLADPEYVVGLTEIGGIVAHDVIASSSQSTFGGSKISVRSYLARGFIVTPEVNRLQSVKLRSMKAHYHGLMKWSQIKSSEVNTVNYPNGRAKEMTYTITDIVPSVGQTTNGIKVEIGTTWSATQKRADEFVAATPLAFAVSGEDPTEWKQLMRPLRAFQDLVSLAYVAFVPCQSGTATLDYKGDEPMNSCEFWSGELMATPTNVKTISETLEFPIFTLASLGGVDGVCRWIDLAEKYPRAVGPLTSDQRNGIKSVEVELLSIAVAIEYWVAACKRDNNPRPEWTKHGKNPADTLARSLGPIFSDFVGGDVPKWSRLFWDRYEALKHDPAITYDGYELVALMRSARVLMMCALTKQVSGTDAPVEMICESHKFDHLSRETKKLLEKNPTLFKKK